MPYDDVNLCFAGARKMFDEMIAAEYTPSPFAYQKLIAAHAFHGESQKIDPLSTQNSIQVNGTLSTPSYHVL